MRSELREFYEGEMQALDDLIAVLIVHDAVVVDEIRSIMRKDIIHKIQGIYGLKFAVFSSFFSLTHIEFGCIDLPLAEQKKMLDHLAKLPDVRFLSSEEREKYDESIKAVDDYYSGLYGSYVEGEKKGIAKGIAEGRAEGELSKGLTIARNLLSMGMSWSQIMQATGLTEEELKPLQA